MTKKYENRVLISFDGKCPMKCKHCFTYELKKEEFSPRRIDEIIKDVNIEKSDIIYVSHTYENFIDEAKGIELCRKLYNKYSKDIFIITRCSLSDNAIIELKNLNSEMKRRGNQLFFAVSLCANESYGISENVDICPTPQYRLYNLERLYRFGVKTILLLRPIFPDNIVSVIEYLELIKEAKNYIDAVISSGIIVTDSIMKQLNLSEMTLKFMKVGDSAYLDNIERDKIKYVDVESELKLIQNYCELNAIPFFRHSMPALSYIMMK